MAISKPSSVEGASRTFGDFVVPCPYIEVEIEKAVWKDTYSRVTQNNAPISAPFGWTPTDSTPTADADNFCYAGCSNTPTIYFSAQASAYTEIALDITLSVKRMCSSAIPESAAYKIE